jgi:hypothetical protein
MHSRAPHTPGDLKPYPLPPAASAEIKNLAANSDILILGEIHGTQEVPELVASLLTPLAEVDYHILALEVPNNVQGSFAVPGPIRRGMLGAGRHARGGHSKIINLGAGQSSDA